MKKLNFILIIISSFLYTHLYADYIEDIKSSYNRAIKGEEKLFKIDADLNIVSVDRTYNGIDGVEINAESIYLTSGKFIFLPESLNFSLSYSTNLNNLFGSSDLETSYIDTGLNIYSNEYFRTRFEYFNHRFTSLIKNKEDFAIVVEDKHGSHGVVAKYGGEMYDVEYIEPNEIYKTNDSYYTRNSIIFVSNHGITSNFGFNYGLEEGSKPHPYQVPGTTYVFADVEQKGTRVAIGYYKDLKDDKFYLNKAEIYQRKFTRYYENKFLCSNYARIVLGYPAFSNCTGGAGGSINWEGKLSKPTFGYNISGGMNLELMSYNIRLNGSLDYEKQEFDGYLGNWDLSEETYTYTLGGGITF